MDVSAIASKCVGWPYEPHGRFEEGKPPAVDCYGLFLYVMGELGTALPDPYYKGDWTKKGLELFRKYHELAEPVDREDAQPGDAVLLQTCADAPDHIGVYLGSSKFLHCVENAGVVISRINIRFSAQRVIKFYRMRKT